MVSTSVGSSKVLRDGSDEPRGSTYALNQMLQLGGQACAFGGGLEPDGALSSQSCRMVGAPEILVVGRS